MKIAAILAAIFVLKNHPVPVLHLTVMRRALILFAGSDRYH
ncbi:MAG: hypothetical protein ACU88J_06740 [Gammaproteobacteria bacterium]